MKKNLLLACLIALTCLGASFNVSVVDRNGSSSDLFFDREERVSGFYSSFPEGFTPPDEVGSFSFTDDSLKNPDLLLNISGRNRTLYREKIQLFYASISGNLTEPLLTHAARIGEVENGYTTVDVEISSFEAILPGRIYAGLVNRSNTSYTPENLSIVESSMEGSFDISPRVFKLDNSTRLWFRSVTDSRERRLHPGRDVSSEILVSVRDEGEIRREFRTFMGANRTLNFSLDGGEEVYVNSILSLETRAFTPCGEVSGDSVYFIMNGSKFNADPDNSPGGNDSCMTVDLSEDSVLDFANQTLDGMYNSSENDTDCGLTVNRTVNFRVKNSRVTDFNRGICVLESNTSVEGTHTSGNRIGIYSENSFTEVSDIRMRNNLSEIETVSSRIKFDRIDLRTAEIKGEGQNISIDDVENPPPKPNGTLEVGEFAEIYSGGGNPMLSSIGFYYPPPNQTNVDPQNIFKIDETPQGYSYRNLSGVLEKPSKNFIYTEVDISSLSIFAPYGEKPPGNDSEEGGDQPEDQPGGGGGGGSGGGGGGGGGGLPGTGPGVSPEPSPIKLNLSLVDRRLVLQQGEAGSFNFTVENYGDVYANGTHVTGIVRKGWSIGRKDFRSIAPNQTVSGGILLEVYQSEIPGNYTFPIEIRNDNGSIFDREVLKVTVEARKRIRDLRVVEGPTFLTLQSGETQSVAFLLRNTGDFDLEDVSARAENLENCVAGVEGDHSLETGRTRSLEYRLDVKESERRCVGLIVFESENSDRLAIKPVRINIVKPTVLDRVTRNILPLIVLLWTVLTIFWIRRVRNER